MPRTGLNRGLVVTAFNSHTLFGIDKNLRTTFTMLIVKSVYDQLRGLAESQGLSISKFLERTFNGDCPRTVPNRSNRNEIIRSE
jgi:hypothetical protein